MALKWPDKDKDEQLDYNVDWSRFLGDDTITSVKWFIDNASEVKTEVNFNSLPQTIHGLLVASKTNTSTVSTIRLGLGTNNNRYKIYCQITTAEGLTYERAIFLRIKEK